MTQRHLAMSLSEHNYKQKGKFIDGGLSGIVELLPSGLISKSPWPDFRKEDSRREIANEHEIYKHLGPHPRLVPMEGYTEEGALLLQHMRNGNLADYLRAHPETISMSQRLQWATEAAEGLEFLHSKGVIHCDVKPKNFLLDDSFGLKIVDFSSSSLNGSYILACKSTRFSLPQGRQEKPTIRSDTFALGCTTYVIMTGEDPYENLHSDEVVHLFEDGDFPSSKGTPCDEYIRQCWVGEIKSTREAYDCMKTLVITAR
jgi:serine/threonine protein kinase